MPRYDFECQNPDCGLTFDRVLSMDTHLVHECPACHEMAPRVWQGQVFAFDFTPTGGDQTQRTNTGVHRDDYPTADRAVGQDAEVRWAYYHERAEVKQAVRDHTGAVPLQRVDGRGYTEYESLLPNKARERARKARTVVGVLQDQQREAKAQADRRVGRR